MNKSMISIDASMATQQNLQPHFDCRRYIQLFPFGDSMGNLKKRSLKNPEFVLADRIGNALPYNGDQLAESILALEANAAYDKIIEKENFILFKRRAVEALQWQEL